MKLWTGLRKIHSVMGKTMTAEKVEKLCTLLAVHFHTEVINELRKAILKGPIFTTEEVTDGEYRGNFTKRINSFFWKRFGVQFSDKKNVLNDVIATVNNGKISHDLWGIIVPKMYWNAGDFGDDGSCFWGSNTIARYFLSNWPHFGALLCYKQVRPATEKDVKEFSELKPPNNYRDIVADGFCYTGFARCLLAFDYPKPGLVLGWNGYPNNPIEELFSGLRAGLSLDNPDVSDYATKQVLFKNNNSDTGWFYTNNRDCYLMGPENLIKSITEVDLKEKKTPKLENFEEYLGACICGKPVLKDRGDYVALHELKLCSSCSRKNNMTVLNCWSCGEKTVHVGGMEKHPSTAFSYMDEQMVLHFICPECNKKDVLTPVQEKELVC